MHLGFEAVYLVFRNVGMEFFLKDFFGLEMNT